MESTADELLSGHTSKVPLQLRAEWPTNWNSQVVFFLGVVGVVFGAVALIVTGIQTWDIGARVGLVVLCFIFPFVVQVTWVYGRVIWYRTRTYPQIYTQAERGANELKQLQQHIALLIQALVMAGMQTFHVVNLTERNGTLFLVLDSPSISTLESGVEVLVVDSLNLDMLGWFTTTQPTAEGYFAKKSDNADILNAVWWGLLHKEATKHVKPQINAMALLLSYKTEVR